jgi:hypothetical protein
MQPVDMCGLKAQLGGPVDHFLDDLTYALFGQPIAITDGLKRGTCFAVNPVPYRENICASLFYGG